MTIGYRFYKYRGVLYGGSYKVKTNPELLKSDSSFGKFINSSFFTSKSIIFFSSLSFFIWSSFWNSRFSRIRLRDSTYIQMEKIICKKIHLKFGVGKECIFNLIKNRFKFLPQFIFSLFRFSFWRFQLDVHKRWWSLKVRLLSADKRPLRFV